LLRKTQNATRPNKKTARKESANYPNREVIMSALFSRFNLFSEKLQKIQRSVQLKQQLEMKVVDWCFLKRTFF
jgi:hypothetical protein